MVVHIQGGKNKMPQRDGTGPEEKGARTGRGLENCPTEEAEEAEEEETK